jgi:hypothetical protein
MSLRDLPKSLIDAVCEVISDSTEKRQKLASDLRAEGLRRFGVKRESQLIEADQKALYAWVQIKLDEASCGCGEDLAKEDHMPGDEALYNKDGEIKKQMDEDELADKDHDGDGEVETSSDEYLGSRDKAIKAAMKNEESAEEVSEDDETDLAESIAQTEIKKLSENVAISPNELATNGAVAVGDASVAQPKHADVIRDTDPYTNITEYRLLLQYATNEGTRIYPPVSLPGARSVSDLRTLVSGLPDFNEAVDAALVHASSTDINSVSESVKEQSQPLTESATVVFVSDVYKKSNTLSPYYKEGRKESVKSVQDISHTLGIRVKDLFDTQESENAFNEALKTGKTVYVYQNPYDHDINNTVTLGASLSQSQAERNYDDALGDI